MSGRPMTDNQRLAVEDAHDALTDVITALTNNEYLRERMEEEFAACKRARDYLRKTRLVEDSL